MSEWDSIMVDLETTGIDPVHSHIIQIAAVRFNIADKTIDTGEMFDRALAMTTPNRFWNPDTLEWWSNQKAGIYDSIMARAEDPGVVIEAFQDFINRTVCSRPVMLWAKPTSFEWPFLQSYFNQFNKGMPLRYSNAKDLNSYIYGRGHTDVPEFWKGIPFEGDAHNAIFDVIHQIKGAFLA